MPQSGIHPQKYNMVQELVDGGTFLNCPWDAEGLEKHLPGQVKKFIADHNIKFYTIDGVKLGIETGMARPVSTRSFSPHSSS